MLPAAMTRVQFVALAIYHTKYVTRLVKLSDKNQRKNKIGKSHNYQSYFVLCVYVLYIAWPSLLFLLYISKAFFLLQSFTIKSNLRAMAQ